jgi:hypothetical protein
MPLRLVFAMILLFTGGGLAFASEPQADTSSAKRPQCSKLSNLAQFSAAAILVQKRADRLNTLENSLRGLIAHIDTWEIDERCAKDRYSAIAVYLEGIAPKLKLFEADVDFLGECIDKRISYLTPLIVGAEYSKSTSEKARNEQNQLESLKSLLLTSKGSDTDLTGPSLIGRRRSIERLIKSVDGNFTHCQRH